MVTKRKIREDEIERETEIKKQARMEEDRLSNLPHDLQLHILSSLDTKDAFKLSLLSKTWVSLGTRIPLLEFNDSVFKNLHVFDKFVNRVLSQRDRSAKLDRLTFNRCGICSAKILEKVFDYAFSHGIKQLEAKIDNSRNHTWPVCLRNSFESLTNLKLQSGIAISCPFLGPRSRSFKNLTDLYLERTLITDLDPFSGFPVLERLTLVKCEISTAGDTLSIHACNLSELTISGCLNFSCCELITPRLGFFEYQGSNSNFPKIRTHEDVPVLDTIVLGYNGFCEMGMFEDLLSLICSLPNVICLRLFAMVVDILTLFQNELVNSSSPFRMLKCLELDCRYPGYEIKHGYNRPWPFKYLEIPATMETYMSAPFAISSTLKDYLLQNSPDAKVAMI